MKDDKVLFCQQKQELLMWRVGCEPISKLLVNGTPFLGHFAPELHIGDIVAPWKILD